MSAMAHSAGWSLAVSMAAALLIVRLRDGRRRAAISEALHELRRPLQALALGDQRRAGTGEAGSLRLVARALERLEGAVEGRRSRGETRERLRGESVLRAAVGRWRARVALDGGSLELRWWAGEARLAGDRDALERALDNLIVNAIEHGRPPVVVEGRLRDGRLWVTVADSGPAPASARGGARPGGLKRAGGVRPRRRGHGLRVVRRIAAEHGGRFVLRHSAAGTLALLELPLDGAPGDA
jgi:two-component system osmolarity sensor histidine kinase EnvZ